MKKFYIAALILTCVVSLGFAESLRSAGKVSGRMYNDVWKIWNKFDITVYATSSGHTYITGDGILGPAGHILTEDGRKEMIRLLNKSGEWAITATKEQLEITKKLGEFSRWDFLPKTRKRLSEDSGNIILSFFAANKGSQTDVVLAIQDRKNEFKKSELYLSQEEVKQLVTLLLAVPATLNELNEQEKKAELLR